MCIVDCALLSSISEGFGPVVFNSSAAFGHGMRTHRKLRYHRTCSVTYMITGGKGGGGGESTSLLAEGKSSFNGISGC